MKPRYPHRRKRPHVGTLLCRVLAVTPGWLDCEVAQTRQKVTFVFKYKPTVKQFEFYELLREKKLYRSFYGTKTDERDIFVLRHVAAAGIAIGKRSFHNTAIRKQHAFDALEQTKGTPARARHRKSLGVRCHGDPHVDYRGAGLAGALRAALPAGIEEMNRDRAAELHAQRSRLSQDIWKNRGGKPRVKRSRTQRKPGARPPGTGKTKK
jgi:hypothetical protein